MLLFTIDRVRKSRNIAPLSRSCDEVFSQLVQGGVSPDELYDSVCKQVFAVILFLFPPTVAFGSQNREDREENLKLLSIGWPNNLELAGSGLLSRICRVYNSHCLSDH